MSNAPLPHDNGFVIALQIWAVMFGIASFVCLLVAMFTFKATSVQAVLNAIYFVLLSSAMWRAAKFGYDFQKALRS